MSLNKVQLIGNCTATPETKFLPSGTAVTNLSIATNKRWKDKDGQKQESVEFHRVVFFNRLAEVAGEYLKKGSKVYIEGSLRTNKWQDKDGNDRYTTEVVANEMQMLDSKGGDSSSSGSRHSSSPQQSSPQVTQVDNDMSNFDDSSFDEEIDIPF